MQNKINRSELFSICVLLLYGSFSSTKYALTMGKYALPFTAAALAAELCVLGVICILPAVKAPAVGFLLSLAPLCVIAMRFYGGARLLNRGDFGYIPFWMLILSSFVLCVYLAIKDVSASGRVAVIALICMLISLVFLTAVYAKDFNASEIFKSFGDRSNALVLVLSSAPELLTVYLAKSFFACEEKDRAAKPPLEKHISEKERRGLYSKIALLAFAVSATLRLGVTAGLLSLADSRLYALSENSAVFAARLLQGINLSPLISGGVYLLTLFSLSFTLCLTVQFSKMTVQKSR